MTAFASQTGSEGGVSWVLEMRGVNAKGLDIRLRLPDRMSALEAPLRAKLAKRLARGNVGVTLRVEEASTGGTVRLDEDILEAYVNAAIRVRTIAKNKGLRLAEATAPDYLGLRGVVRSDGALSELPEAAILAGFDAALEDFVQMRAAEGRALAVILRDQLAQITALVTTAAQQAEARKGQVAATLKANLARVMDNTDGADADRVAQELALLAVKADVSEEIDRLVAHVAATEALLSADGPVGRKLDFLMQEFNREANTLCSKAGAAELTATGLDLKAVIDQMREQVQNVE